MKFKVNDRVKCIDTDSGANQAVKGDTGKIIFVRDDYLHYLVEFDQKRGFYHSGTGRGKSDQCYWCSEKMLELIANKPIIIYQDGDKVIALDKNTNKKAVAKCSPYDEFDFMTGAKLAFERLTSNEIDRVAKVGEYVKVTMTGGHSAKLNEILRVISVERGALDGWVTCEYFGRKCTLRREQYVVVENYMPDDDKTIKVGDKVKVINTGEQYTTYRNWVKTHVSDDLMFNFDINKGVDVSHEFIVKVIAPHEDHLSRLLAYIQDNVTKRCYLIGVDGLEKC